MKPGWDVQAGAGWKGRGREVDVDVDVEVAVLEAGVVVVDVAVAVVVCVDVAKDVAAGKTKRLRSTLAVMAAARAASVENGMADASGNMMIM